MSLSDETILRGSSEEVRANYEGALEALVGDEVTPEHIAAVFDSRIERFRDLMEQTSKIEYDNPKDQEIMMDLLAKSMARDSELGDSARMWGQGEKLDIVSQANLHREVEVIYTERLAYHDKEFISGLERLTNELDSGK